MHIDYLLLDFVFVLSLVVGFSLIPVVQVMISCRYVKHMNSKVGPEYWGNIYGGSGKQCGEATIALHPPCRDMQNNYGKQA